MLAISRNLIEEMGKLRQSFNAEYSYFDRKIYLSCRKCKFKFKAEQDYFCLRSTFYRCRKHVCTFYSF